MGRDEEIEQLKKEISPRDLAPLFDHTNLYPTSTRNDIAKLCDEAREYGFASVCVLPTRVEYAFEKLKGSGVAVCTVIGFPLGSNIPEIKAHETSLALLDGATEIDMVVNNGSLLDGNDEYFLNNICTVAEKGILETKRENDEEITLKCIIEAGYLSPAQVERAVQHILEASKKYPSIHFFAKTSTGMELDGLLCEKYDGKKKGARREDLEIMSASGLSTKISGGVRTYDDAIDRLYSTGVRTREDINPYKRRIGASASVKIVTTIF